MIFEHPERLLAIAVFLMLFGCVMPFLMVVRLVESTFLLNFLSFGASVLGLLLGTVGFVAYRGKHKKKNDEEDFHR